VNAELTAAVLKHVRVFKMMTPAPKESQLPRDALTAGKLTGLTLQRTGNPWRQVSELNSLSVNPEEDRESLAAGF
jgi:hypothetical protein